MTPAQVYALVGSWLYDSKGQPKRRPRRRQEDSPLSDLVALTTTAR